MVSNEKNNVDKGCELSLRKVARAHPSSVPAKRKKFRGKKRDRIFPVDVKDEHGKVSTGRTMTDCPVCGRMKQAIIIMLQSSIT